MEHLNLFFFVEYSVEKISHCGMRDDDERRFLLKRILFSSCPSLGNDTCDALR